MYGVIGDAEIELGHYPQAFAAFNRMTALKPSVASYARVSYARELLGDTAGAVRAMELASSAAVGEREAYAWTRVQLGLLQLSTGRAAAAAHNMRIALASFPAYSVRARRPRAGRGRARAPARGARRSRRRRWRACRCRSTSSFLGDLDGALGHRAAAAKQYALIGVIERLLAANGVRNDLDIALFDADHGSDPARTVALARKGYAERPSIVGDDVLGWALARAGRCSEALAVLDPRAPARHEGRAEDLPPRLRRRVPRPHRGGAHLLPARARDQPALLDPVGAGRPEGGFS